MNDFSHLESKICTGRGLFPHFILEINKVADFGIKQYVIRAYTYSNDGIKRFKTVKDEEEMSKFKLGDKREYQLFIKRVFGE